MRKKLVLLAASLAMVLASTAALAQTESGGSDEQVRCLLPEGCDTNGDGVPELRAGESVLDEETGTGVVQYENAA